VLPENIAHAFLSLLFLLSGQWMAFILNLPLVAYNVNKSVVVHSGPVLWITYTYQLWLRFIIQDTE
jgi:hypothetical protein